MNYLVRALSIHHSSPQAPATTAQLTAAFAEYERVRLPRSTELVRKARVRGERRVESVDPNDLKAIEERENSWIEEYSEANYWKAMDDYAKEPSEGINEI